MKNLVLEMAVITAVFSSCAVGRHLTFENKVAGPGYLVSRKATVVMQDKRAEVLSGKEKNTFCGHSYSTVHIAYNIQTKTGKPLADEMAESIRSNYNAAGAAATIIPVGVNDSPDSVIAVFKSGNSERLLYFTLNKWEARAVPGFSAIRYEVIYDIALAVFDKNGAPMAAATVHDTFVEENGAITSIAVMQSYADGILKDKTAVLFAEPAVKTALTASQ